MAFPRDARDTVVELFLGGNWVEIPVADLYGREPMQISRGRADESQALTPSHCTFTLGNRSGQYDPNNPMGPYYQQIGRNTPIRVSVRTARDTFSRTVSGGVGTANTGQAYLTVGAGGTVQASDWNVNGTQVTMSVPAADAYRAAYFSPTVIQHHDVDQVVTVSVPITNVTGGSLEPAAFLFHVSATPTFYQVKLSITTTETIEVSAVNPAGSVFGTATIPGITHTSSQALRFRAQCDARVFRAKVWPSTSPEPYAWQWETRHLGKLSGAVGLRAGVAAGNSNTKPIVSTLDDYDVRVPRFAGEISAWNLGWASDAGTVDAVVRVEAAGILRRLGQGAAPLRSAPYRAGATSDADYYCPLEEAPLVVAGQPAIGTSAMRLTGDVPDQTRLWGNGVLAPWLPNVLAREGINNLYVGNISMPAFTSEWTVGWVMAGGKAHNDLLIQGPTQTWRIEFSQTAGTVRVHDVTGAITSSPVPAVYDDGPHLVSFAATNSVPVTMNWNLVVDGHQVMANTSVSGTLEPAIALTFRNLVDNASEPLAIGHVTAGSVGGGNVEALFGYVGETAGNRMLRISTEAGIPFSYWGNSLSDLTDSAAMGPQYPDSALAIIEECVAADLGEMYEPRGMLGIEYRARKKLYNQDPAMQLVFASDHLAPPLDPVDDDQLTRNDVTVARRDGGSHQETLASGALSILDPPTGIGRYDTQVTVNVASDDQLPGIAGWLLANGTVEGARYPQVTVSLGRPAIANSAAMANVPMDVNIGDRITISSASAINVFSTITLLVRGIDESIDAPEHLITYNCTPETPYEVIQVDTAGKNKVNTGGALLHAAVSSSATTLDVATTSRPLWVTDAGQMPVPITIGGEDISATAIANELITFVAAGTATHADRGSIANVTPGLPAGLAAGDLLLCLAAIRRTDVQPTAPTGYATIGDIGNLRLFGKIAGSSESAPVVDFPGGGSGDTISGQTAAFRGKFHDVSKILVNHNGHPNESGQDIPYTGLSVVFNNCLVLWFAWKQDDWTSVTSPGTEIGEPSSTTGNDQGIVWSYTIQTTATAVAGGSFTVTGGASAISRAGVLVLQCDRQTFAVTRSVNGVSKAHAAGAAVALTRRAPLGL